MSQEFSLIGLQFILTKSVVPLFTHPDPKA